MKPTGVRVSVSGLRALDANLGQLKKATARAVLRRVLMKAGEPIRQRMADLAPDDPSTGAPDLHRSMAVSAKLKNTVGQAAFAEAMRGGSSHADAVTAMRNAQRAAAGEGSFAEVYVGPTADQFHAHLQEFGTRGHGPRPFARPAFEEKKGEALGVIRSELSGEINKAVARMKRRAAKGK